MDIFGKQSNYLSQSVSLSGINTTASQNGSSLVHGQQFGEQTCKSSAGSVAICFIGHTCIGILIQLIMMTVQIINERNEQSFTYEKEIEVKSNVLDSYATKIESFFAEHFHADVGVHSQ